LLDRKRRNLLSSVWEFMNSRYYKALLGTILLILFAGSASAQYDPFGTTDLVYIDSAEAGPGEDVSVRFLVRNDEKLGSLSIPITYNPSLLTLRSIDFSGSRVDYIENKITKPEEIKDIDGHFVVAVIQILEDPIGAGDGAVFTATFKVADSAVPGTVTTIDSLYYPPGGDLVLVGFDDATIIHPAFVPGKVVVGGPNRAPVFDAIEKHYVLEGDTLDLEVAAADPDGDKLIIAVTSKPAGAAFVDHGDGSGWLIWSPGFVGPNSADGSPFELAFWASDGNLSAQQQAVVEVVNRNRAPVISAPAEVEITAGGSLFFTVSAADPDFETVSWAWASSLSGAAFDGDNPGQFSWTAPITDSGTSVVTFIASDAHGFSDTALVTVTVHAAPVYSLRLDTMEVYPGDIVDYHVQLGNMLPVSGFNVLFNYDPATLTLLDLTKEGTRADGLEYYSITYDDNGIAGNVRIIGVADQGGGTPPLAAGDGAIALAKIRVTGNLAYAGMTIPIRFRFLDIYTRDDNTLADSSGEKIEQDDIIYEDGWIAIAGLDHVRIGDINLNGLAAEISDVIYFTNYFIDPQTYSFNALQYANSDVNRDNIVASVSDLVALINMLIAGQAGKPASTEDLDGTVMIRKDSDRTVLAYETDFAVGGLFISLEAGEGTEVEALDVVKDNMTLDFREEGGEIRFIMYSLNGDVLPAGSHDLFALEGAGEVQISVVDLASADGRHVSVAVQKETGDLPVDFALRQNYPNPFNPTTSIGFQVPAPSNVRLVVYNVLGRSVKTLLDKEFPRGTYTVTWDGTDESGRPAASGVYLYRLESADVSLSRKMVLLK